MTDFQVGDMVIAPRLFEGELPIDTIVKGRNPFPIRVKDCNCVQHAFTADGKQDIST